MSERVVGYDSMWSPPDEDPRTMTSADGELANYRVYLDNYRMTLEMKCQDLTPAQLATQSVPPSNLSLLGLIRHMARVEHNWFVRFFQDQQEAALLYATAEDDDRDFNGAVGTTECVNDAFTTWKAQIAVSDAWLGARSDDTLGEMFHHRRADADYSARDVLVHMIEEYARHCGHADLLRECIDGRTGQ